MVVSINEKEDAHRLPRADEEPPDWNLTFTLVEKKWISTFDVPAGFSLFGKGDLLSKPLLVEKESRARGSAWAEFSKEDECHERPKPLTNGINLVLPRLKKPRHKLRVSQIGIIGLTFLWFFIPETKAREHFNKMAFSKTISCFPLSLVSPRSIHPWMRSFLEWSFLDPSFFFFLFFSRCFPNWLADASFPLSPFFFSKRDPLFLIC